MAYTPPQPVPLWPAFFPSAPVVPKLYYDALSPEQRIKKICEALHRICEYANELGVAINVDHQIIEQLEADFTTFMESGFDDYYKEQLAAYIEEHFSEIIYKILNTGIFFGLTQDGYFCANVAYQLTFVLDTIIDYSSDNYGRLTITY